jgi:hypothetical protein
MRKNITKITFRLNDKDYDFLCESDSPLSDVREIGFYLIKYVGQIEEDLKKSKEVVEEKVLQECKTE